MTVILTHTQRRALISALKAGQVVTDMTDPPGVFYISGLDIRFEVKQAEVVNTTTQETT